jgi:hypothetical protein
MEEASVESGPLEECKSQALQELELLTGHSAQRIRDTPDKRLSVIDVTVAVTGQSRDGARKIMSRLFEEYSTIATKCLDYNFPGFRGPATPVAPISVIVEYIMLLPGKAAALQRERVSSIFVRYIGGDLSLIGEVQALHQAQQILQQVPETQRTPVQQLAAACGEAVRDFTLQIYPQPDKLLPSRSQRDMYLMFVGNQKPPETLFMWKIGRSDDPLTRASQLNGEVKRDRNEDWKHTVHSIFRGSGVMESLHHKEFQSSIVDGTSEYFWGSMKFPEEVLSAWKRLTVHQLEIQFQEKRKAEVRIGIEEDFKRRKLEVEIASEELKLQQDRLKLKQDELLLKAEEIVVLAKADAEATLIRAKAEAEAVRIQSGHSSNVPLEQQGIPAEEEDWSSEGGLDLLAAYNVYLDSQASNVKTHYPKTEAQLTTISEVGKEFMKNNPNAFKAAGEKVKEQRRLEGASKRRKTSRS